MLDAVTLDATTPLPKAIASALDQMGALRDLNDAEVDTSLSGLAALIATDLEERESQAGSGVGAVGGMVLVMHITCERLNSRVFLYTFLAVTMEAAFWGVGVADGSYGNPGHFLTAADVTKRDDLIEMFRFAGGGVAVDQ